MMDQNNVDPAKIAVKAYGASGGLVGGKTLGLMAVEHHKPKADVKPDGSGYNTFGGYSTHIVSGQDFLLEIPGGLNISAAALILYAGLTTYLPLKRQEIKVGDKVRVAGIGSA